MHVYLIGMSAMRRFIFSLFWATYRIICTYVNTTYKIRSNSDICKLLILIHACELAEKDFESEKNIINVCHKLWYGEINSEFKINPKCAKITHFFLIRISLRTSLIFLKATICCYWDFVSPYCLQNCNFSSWWSKTGFLLIPRNSQNLT